MKKRISVIVPVLNEATFIKPTLERITSAAVHECIVVDGGSTDGTQAIVKQFPVTMLDSAAGRGKQLIHGCNHATGDILLFVHGDTLLPASFVDDVHLAEQRTGFSIGAFRFRVDDTRFSMRIIEFLVWLRCWWSKTPYGDQALFVRKQDFDRLGGFRDLPVMEDFDLVVRFGKQGRVVFANSTVITSARRWQKLGALKTTWVNRVMVAKFLAGEDPQKLADYYRCKPMDRSVVKNSASGDSTKSVSSSSDFS